MELFFFWRGCPGWGGGGDLTERRSGGIWKAGFIRVHTADGRKLAL